MYFDIPVTLLCLVFSIDDINIEMHVLLITCLLCSAPPCRVHCVLSKPPVTPGFPFHTFSLQVCLLKSEMPWQPQSFAAELLPSSDRISLFHSSCSAILDSVAPLKYRHPKLTSHQWFDDWTTLLKRKRFCVGHFGLFPYVMYRYGAFFHMPIGNNLFARLEDDGFLDLSKMAGLHLFSCHHVFVPRLQATLDAFPVGWDYHPIRTEGNVTPNQLWEMGMIQNPVTEPDGAEVLMQTLILQCDIIINFNKCFYCCTHAWNIFNWECLHSFIQCIEKQYLWRSYTFSILIGRILACLKTHTIES